MQAAGSPPRKSLSVFALVMITTGIITSIHGAPSMAEYGFSLICIYLMVAVVFLLPSALISAELATGWPGPDSQIGALGSYSS